jgi:hypothetical protein
VALKAAGPLEPVARHAATWRLPRISPHDRAATTLQVRAACLNTRRGAAQVACCASRVRAAQLAAFAAGAVAGVLHCRLRPRLQASSHACSVGISLLALCCTRHARAPLSPCPQFKLLGYGDTALHAKLQLCAGPPRTDTAPLQLNAAPLELPPQLLLRPPLPGTLVDAADFFAAWPGWPWSLELAGAARRSNHGMARCVHVPRLRKGWQGLREVGQARGTGRRRR